MMTRRAFIAACFSAALLLLDDDEEGDLAHDERMEP